MKELTDERLNLAICEWLGWTAIHFNAGKLEWIGTNPSTGKSAYLPNHITGIEALGNMQAAIGLLNEGLRGQFMEKLYKLCDDGIEASYEGEHDYEGMFGLLIIPAKLHAIALIRVVKPELFV